MTVDELAPAQARRTPWERIAPWLAGAGAIAMLVVPIGGYLVIHDSQQSGQAEVAAFKKQTEHEISGLVAAFKCQQKAMNGLLQDVPLGFSGDKNRADYARIAHGCKVVEESAG